MKERPIIFSGPMVRAILDGRKAQTRRIVKPQPPARQNEAQFPCIEKHEPLNGVRFWQYAGDGTNSSEAIRCPYGAPGDRLWVRESWRTARSLDHVRPSNLVAGAPVEYMADRWNPGFGMCDKGKGRPSIFLPRWASRLTLEITGARVERLNEISEEDAYNEGIEVEPLDMSISAKNYLRKDAWFNNWGVESVPDFQYEPSETLFRKSYETLWESINGPGSWAANPWIWCVSFRKLEGGQP